MNVQLFNGSSQWQQTATVYLKKTEKIEKQ